MDKKILENFRTRLLQEKKELEQEIKKINDSGIGEPLKEVSGELSSYDNHSSDLGAETFERGKDIALRDNQKIILKKVNDALGRIDKGSYGYCENCGEEIPLERLEAVPYATLCLRCREEIEARSYTMKRPVEEKAISPPFGRTFLDGEDSTGYDGEDAWQEVARYGSANSPQDVGGAESYEDIYIDKEEPRGTVERMDNLSKDDVINE